jgi:glycosyltransferase involved in cell wall biosynthesis
MVVEAYAAGVPVIASGIGALPELVSDGVSGLLVKPRATQEWVSAIERLMVDERAQALGDGAWGLWRDTHTPERSIQDLEYAYGVAATAAQA